MAEARLLNIDDDAERRAQRTQQLRQAGFAVTESDGELGPLLALAANPPEPSSLPDLLLVDARGEAAGLELTRRLRAHPATRSLPLVHLWAGAQAAARGGGLDSATDGFLTPPVDPELLLATVRSLLRARELLRALGQSQVILQNIADAVTAQDASGKLIYANDAALRLLGAAGAPGRDDPRPALLDGFEIFDEAGRPLDLEQLPGRRVLRGEPEARAVLCWRHRGDPARERWTVVQARPVHDEAGRVQLAINILHDLTAERRAAERLELLTHASAALAASLDSTTTLARVAGLPLPLLGDWSIVHLSEDAGMRRIGQHVDPALQPLLDELLAGPPPPLPLPPAGASAARAIALDAAALQARLPPDELERARALGLRSGLTAPLTARSQTFGALTVLSARERDYEPAERQLLQELAHRAALAIDNARVLREAEEAAAARRDLVAVVAHDLKNPLNAIAMAGTLLVRHAPVGPEGDRLRRQSSIITRASDRMNRLIHDLLDVSAIDSGRLELERQPIALGSLVSEAVELMATMAQERSLVLERQVAPEDEALELLGDRERLLQVFSNLIGNAIKFTPEGGRVTVRGGRGPLGVEFAVIDTGCGIAPEHLPHVFDRYWRLRKHNRAGTGLGLSIVKGIVEAHQGTVSVDTVLGRGCSFIVRLPRGL